MHETEIDRAWSLVVLAVPAHYRAHTRQDEEANRFARYAFKLRLDGAEPEGATRAAPAAKVIESGDDGVVVYLNGHELVRQNIPAGPTTVRTRAVRRIEGSEKLIYHRHVVPATALKPGRNVVAAEVHQINASSSDLFFDLQLTSSVDLPLPTTVDLPVARVSAGAREVTLAYLKQHTIAAGTRIPDGYIDGGRGMTIAGDGTAQSGREVMVVDRARDPELRKHLEYARSAAVADLPTLERATLLARYVDKLYSPESGRQFSEEACTLMLEPYLGKELLIGEAIHAGVCRHRALVFTLLADEAELSVSLPRGNYGTAKVPDGHAWNELILDNGQKLIVDVMNPRPGFAFPKTTDRVAERYPTDENAPYYPKAKIGAN